jgi:molybdopterin biosynthesis enzyme MoaB
VGVAQGSLVVNLPGSPSAATESLDAILAAIPHALETLAGPFDHERQHRGEAGG